MKKIFIQKIKLFKNFFKSIFNISQTGGNGGYTNIDEPTLNFLIRKFKIKSFLDIGCGNGGMVFYALLKDLYARGVEGDLDSIPIDCPLILNVDYRKSSLNHPFSFDLGWSVEVLEHIPENCLNNILKDFANCKYILFTAAPKGWGGFGHVNEQNEEYWLDKFNKLGFILDKKSTQEIRELSNITFKGNKRNKKKQFIKNRGLFMKNIKLLSLT